jgi:hypothetical protein
MLTDTDVWKVLTYVIWQVETTEDIIHLGGLRLRLSPAFQSQEICPLALTDVYVSRVITPSLLSLSLKKTDNRQKIW